MSRPTERCATWPAGTPVIASPSTSLGSAPKVRSSDQSSRPGSMVNTPRKAMMPSPGFWWPRPSKAGMSFDGALSRSACSEAVSMSISPCSSKATNWSRTMRSFTPMLRNQLGFSTSWGGLSGGSTGTTLVDDGAGSRWMRGRALQAGHGDGGGELGAPPGAAGVAALLRGLGDREALGIDRTLEAGVGFGERAAVGDLVVQVLRHLGAAFGEQPVVLGLGIFVALPAGMSHHSDRCGHACERQLVGGVVAHGGATGPARRGWLVHCLGGVRVAGDVAVLAHLQAHHACGG